MPQSRNRFRIGLVLSAKPSPFLWKQSGKCLLLCPFEINYKLRTDSEVITTKLTKTRSMRHFTIALKNQLNSSLISDWHERTGKRKSNRVPLLGLFSFLRIWPSLKLGHFNFLDLATLKSNTERGPLMQFLVRLLSEKWPNVILQLKIWIQNFFQIFVHNTRINIRHPSHA